MESELNIFKIDIENLLNDIKNNKIDLLNYCKRALSKSRDNLKNIKYKISDIIKEEDILYKVEYKVISIKLNFLSLISAYYMKYDIEKILTLNIELQYMLFSEMLRNLRINQSNINLNILNQNEIIALSIFHRWILRISIYYEYLHHNEEITNIYMMDKIFEHIDQISQISLSCLLEITKLNKKSFILPKPDIYEIIERLEMYLLFEQNEQINEIKDIIEIDKSELNSKIYYDIAIYYLHNEKFKESKNMAEVAIFCHNKCPNLTNNASHLNNINIILNIAKKCLEKNNIECNKIKDIITILGDYIITNYIPVDFFINDNILSTSSITKLIEYCKFNIDGNNHDKIATFLKFIYEYCPVKCVQIQEYLLSIGELTKCQTINEVWNEAPISFLSVRSIVLDKNISEVQKCYNKIKLEQELLHSYIYERIVETLNQLHSIETGVGISYAKTNFLIYEELVTFTSTIDDPFTYDLVNIICQKIAYFKKIKDYNIARDLLKGFFDHITELNKCENPPPYINSLILLVLNETLINTITVSRIGNEDNSSVIISCKKFINTYPNKSLNQDETMIYAVSELCNKNEIEYFTSHNITYEPYSLKEFMLYLNIINNHQTEYDKLPADSHNIWKIIINIINDNPENSSFHKKLLIELVNKIDNSYILTVLISLFISINNFFKKDEIFQPLIIPCTISQDVIINYDNLYEIIHNMLHHLSTKDPSNPLILHIYADLYYALKNYSKSISMYLSMIINVIEIFTDDVPTKFFDYDKTINRMIFICEHLLNFVDALLLTIFLKKKSCMKYFKIIDRIFEYNQNIIDYIPFFYDIDILAYLSDKFSLQLNNQYMRIIELRIKTLSLVNKTPFDIYFKVINFLYTKYSQFT